MRRIIAFVGDTHADHRTRFDEHNRVMRWIITDAFERGAQAFGHAGDVYEADSNSLEREAVADYLAYGASLGPWVVVRGNHDDPRDIEALGRLRTKFPIRAVTRPGSIIPLAVPGDGDFAHVAALPWPSKAYLLAGTELGRAEADAQAVVALKNILRGYGQQFTSAFPHTPRIFLGHVMVRGTRVGISQPPLVGQAFELGIEDLALVNADAYALGHIHLAQEWETHDGAIDAARAPVFYTSSPQRRKNGELDPKGYVLATFEGRRLLSWERIATPVPPMLDVSSAFAMVDGSGECLPSEPLPAEVRGAEVRLKYETAAGDREQAAQAAERLAARLRQGGAASVVLQEVIKIESLARAPEVAAAVTNAARLEAYWAAKGEVPERAGERLAKLAELEAEQAGGKRARPPGAVRYARVSVQGFGPFAERLDVDLDQLPGKLTAVCGGNGRGKSTLLELLHGTVYNDCPTRGSLPRLATAPKAFSEVECETGGAQYVIRQIVEGRGREAWIKKNGELAIGESTKVSAVDAYVEQWFPDPAIALVSSFIAQGSGGFLDQPKGARKGMILKVKGVERLEGVSSAARKKASAVDTAREILEAQLRDKRKPAAEAPRIHAEINAARTALGHVEEGLAAARAGHAAALVEAEQARTRAREILTATAKHGELARAIAKEVEKLDGLDTRIVALRKLIERADQIRAAVASATERSERFGRLQAEGTALEVEAERLRRESAAVTKSLDDARAKFREATRKLTARAEVQRAVAQVPEHEARAARLERKIEATRHELAGLRERHIASADDRIDDLRKGLGEIRDLAEPRDTSVLPDYPAEKRLQGALDVANTTLLADDAARTGAAEVPRLLAAAELRLTESETEARHVAGLLDADRSVAGRLPLIEAAERDLADANNAGHKLKEDAEALVANLATTTDALKANAEALAKLRAELATSNRLAGEAAALERAEATLAELDPQRAAVHAEIQRLRDEKQALGPVPDALDMPNISKLQSAVTYLEAQPALLQKNIGAMEAELAAANRAAAEVAELEGKVSAAWLDYTDWICLAADFGIDGIQAAISNAALPELNALTNSFLHSAFGPRFTVDVRSEALDSKGKRMLETLDVWVYDSQATGGERLAETYSGGELTIIGEALSLALTTLAIRESGATRATLIRDEAGAALDAENGKAWIEMLRRAVEMTRADRLLFVAHSPALVALADSTIDLGLDAP